MTCWRLSVRRFNDGVVADLLSALSAELGAPLMVVGASDRARWQQPIVYAWIRGNEVLYVGRSTVGVERPMSMNHEKLRGFEAEDRLVIWACAAPGPTEGALILRWRPRLNGIGGPRRCSMCGLWRALKGRAYCQDCPPPLQGSFRRL
jgi:hypothetical protein